MNYRRVYIKNSKVFITVVVNKRRKLLIDNIELLRESFQQAKSKIPFTIDAVVILPDHFHLIIVPNDFKQYPNIIKSIKSHFSRHINIENISDYEVSQSRKDKNEKDIWQRRYWEHSITDETDLIKHIDYIHYNPIKHGYVNKAKDWKYSSFHKYVQQGLYKEDWCNFADENKITALNCE